MVWRIVLAKLRSIRDMFGGKYKETYHISVHFRDGGAVGEPGTRVINESSQVAHVCPINAKEEMDIVNFYETISNLLDMIGLILFL